MLEIRSSWQRLERPTSNQTVAYLGIEFFSSAVYSLVTGWLALVRKAEYWLNVIVQVQK